MTAQPAPGMVALSTLHLNDRNPRTIKTEAFQRLCESITRDPEFLALRPIVIDGDGVILGGNQRYRACLHIGLKEVPAEWVRVAANLTPEQRKRFLLIDNAPDGMAGEWDFDVLSADYDLPELEVLGFDKLLAELSGQTWEQPADATQGQAEGQSGETRVTITLPDLAVNQFKRDIADAVAKYNARMA